jgi:hypothetical protein
MRRFVQVILLLNAVSSLAAGSLLLLAPEWFFANVGTFPPFNRHYAGDLGSFQIALGVGLLYALPRPPTQAALLLVAAAGGIIHALNHAFDALNGSGGWGQTLGLLLFAALTLIAFAASSRRQSAQVAREEARFANIGGADQPRDPALQA